MAVGVAVVGDEWLDYMYKCNVWGCHNAGWQHLTVTCITHTVYVTIHVNNTDSVMLGVQIGWTTNFAFQT